MASLLASCERPKDSGKSESSSESSPKVTRANRPLREEAKSPQNKLRAAIAAAMKIEAPDERDRALAVVVRDAIKISPDISAEAFNHLSADSVEKMPLLQLCTKVLVEQNVDEALAWVAKLESEKDIAATKAKIAMILVDSDPVRAVNLAPDTGFGGTKTGVGVSGIVLSRWASKAPSAAAAWAISCPPGEQRKTGIKAVVSRWIQSDSQAAFSWMAKLNNDSDRKEVSRAMAEALVQTLPPFRDSMLASADSAIRSEIQQQMDQITKEAQEKILPAPEE